MCAICGVFTEYRITPTLAPSQGGNSVRELSQSKFTSWGIFTGFSSGGDFGSLDSGTYYGNEFNENKMFVILFEYPGVVLMEIVVALCKISVICIL